MTGETTYQKYLDAFNSEDAIKEKEAMQELHKELNRLREQLDATIPKANDYCIVKKVMANVYHDVDHPTARTKKYKVLYEYSTSDQGSLLVIEAEGNHYHIKPDDLIKLEDTDGQEVFQNKHRARKNLEARLYEKESQCRPFLRIKW